MSDDDQEGPQPGHPAALSGQRWLALETANAGKAIEITPEQAAFLEKLNPCFRERHVESSAPGELLSADTFFVGSLKGVGKVYLHAVVDTFGSYAFGFLHVSKQPEAGSNHKRRHPQCDCAWSINGVRSPGK